MKTIIVLDVELVDLDTFEYFSGGEEFSNEFNDFSVSRLRFQFNSLEIAKIAKNRLSDLNLKYNELFTIELESDNELIEYPIVLLAFNTQSKILLEKDNKLSVNNKLITSPINEDLESGRLVITGEAKKFFESRLSAVKFNELKSQTSSVFIVENIEILANPRYVDSQKYSLREVSEGFFAITNPDGRIQFSQKSYDEIKLGKFKEMRSFFYDDKLLQASVATFVASGEFAFELKKNFDFVKSGISLTIPTLNYI